MFVDKYLPTVHTFFKKEPEAVADRFAYNKPVILGVNIIYHTQFKIFVEEGWTIY